MGFSLDMFFKALMEIIENQEIDEVDMIRLLEEEIKDSMKYAYECGHIRQIYGNQ